MGLVNKQFILAVLLIGLTACANADISSQSTNLTSVRMELQHLTAQQMMYRLGLYRWEKSNSGRLLVFQADVYKALLAGEKCESAEDAVLPIGVTSIGGWDKCLRANGSKESIDQLRAIVNRLDVPGNQVRFTFIEFEPLSDRLDCFLSKLPANATTASDDGQLLYAAVNAGLLRELRLTAKNVLPELDGKFTALNGFPESTYIHPPMSLRGRGNELGFGSLHLAVLTNVHPDGSVVIDLHAEEDWGCLIPGPPGPASVAAKFTVTDSDGIVFIRKKEQATLAIIVQPAVVK